MTIPKTSNTEIKQINLKNLIFFFLSYSPSARDSALLFKGLGEYSTIANSGLQEGLFPENASEG